MKKIPDNSILKKEFTIPFFNMKTMKKIFKKNRKKLYIYKRKRKTFAELLAKNALIGLLLTVIFAVGFFQYGRMWICNEAASNTTLDMNSIRNDIEMKANSENPDYNKEISSAMRLHSGYSIVLDKINAKYQINPRSAENCHVFSCITDENGNIIYSSRMALQTYMKFEEEGKKEAMLMTCDTENKDIPELQQFEEDYMSLAEKEESFHGLNPMENYYIDAKVVMKSAYINKKERTFIPHEADINLTKFYYENSEPDEILETKSYTINIPENYTDYELVTFNLSGLNRDVIANDTYPRYFALGYYGTDKEFFDDTKEKYTFDHSFIMSRSGGGNIRQYQQNANVYIDGKPYVLSVVLQVDVWNKVTKSFYFKILTIFLLVMLVIVFLMTWRKNVRNQAEYMFEDYQKNLTDSLAHDLKTPLMAIGGYAENILAGGLSGDETDKYLNSIMDSVAYTDSIITRTLELNRMNQMNDIHKENTDINRIVEKSVEKYSVTLDERNITVSTDGQAEISANVHLLETTVENLVSNAVKYASENGKINIAVSSECLSISNTVSKKVNIEKLKRPFAKVDTARSNQSGSGLGLAIAETASSANGFELVLSCTDSEFTAELKF